MERMVEIDPFSRQLWKTGRIGEGGAGQDSSRGSSIIQTRRNIRSVVSPLIGRIIYLRA